MEKKKTNPIEEQKEKYEAEYQKAMEQIAKLDIIAKHLEGAILACDELLKLKTE